MKRKGVDVEHREGDIHMVAGREGCGRHGKERAGGGGAHLDENNLVKPLRAHRVILNRF